MTLDTGCDSGKLRPWGLGGSVANQAALSFPEEAPLLVPGKPAHTQPVCRRVYAPAPVEAPRTRGCVSHPYQLSGEDTFLP